MSPEQASGGSVDARSDIYALGCVLYEMLAGEPPFAGPTPQAVIAKRFLQPPLPLRQLRATVPGPVEAAVQKALTQSLVDRFATAAEFSQALSAADVSTVRRHFPTRATLIGAGAALLVGAAAAALWWRDRGRDPALDANLLAVAPFDVLSPELGLWREGLVDLLSRNLDGAGPLRTVPPTAVVRRWNGHADRLSAAELGRRTGAGLTVFGSLVPAGIDSAKLRATLFDTEQEQTLVEFELHDASRRMAQLGDSLAVRILSELGRTRRLEIARVASLGSTSPSALKAFLQGEQWFRRAAWDSAMVSYERAVSLDSGFALAFWRLGRVVGWQRTGFESLSTALSLRAGELNRGLAPRDSLLVWVDSMFQAGTARTFAGYQRLYGAAREAVSRYPDDADAWYALGEVYLHGGKAVPLRESLAAFDRATAVDSGYAPAYIHAIDLASAVQRPDLTPRYAAEYLRRAPNGVIAEGVRLAFDLTDPTRMNSPEVRQRLERASPDVLAHAWNSIANAVDPGEVAIRVARAWVAAPESSAVFFSATARRSILASTLAYRGHLREAAMVSPTDSGFAPWTFAELALLGVHSADTTQSYFSEWLQAGNLLNSRAGLLWWGTQGDSAAILRFRRLADSLARSSPDPGLREEATSGADAARAYLALIRKDTADALRRLEQLPALCEICYFEFLLRLRLHAARGDDRAVLKESERTLWLPRVTEVIRVLEGARAADRLGERDRATRGHQYVVDVWRHADPELQPFVIEARQALQGLTGEPTP